MSRSVILLSDGKKGAYAWCNLGGAGWQPIVGEETLQNREQAYGKGGYAECAGDLGVVEFVAKQDGSDSANEVATGASF